MFTTYDARTGQIISNITSANLAGGLPIIPGQYAASTYYIRNGQAHPYPPVPGPGYWKWDNQSLSWQYDYSEANTALRRLRDRALESVDRVNPMWWTSLTDEKRSQLQAYRQALLDLPQQPGWPSEVVWPTRPTWL